MLIPVRSSHHPRHTAWSFGGGFSPILRLRSFDNSCCQEVAICSQDGRERGQDRARALLARHSSRVRSCMGGYSSSRQEFGLDCGVHRVDALFDNAHSPWPQDCRSRILDMQYYAEITCSGRRLVIHWILDSSCFSSTEVAQVNTPARLR